MSPRAAPGVIRLRIPCAGEEEFLERYAPRYATAGVFVPTDRPRPIGTRLQLKIQFKDGTVRVSGDALVTGHGLPGRSGMTLRLTRLHPGGIAFELSPVAGSAPAVTPVPGGGAPATPPTQGPPAGLADRLFADADDLDEPAAAMPLEVRTGKVKLRLRETSPPDRTGGEPDRTGGEVDRTGGEVDRTGGEVEPTPAPRAAGTAPAAARPPSRVRRGLLPLLSLPVVVAVAAATWYAARTARLREAAVSEQIVLADSRIVEGHLSGAGGDTALDHLLAARGLAPGDDRVTGRLRLLADQFEQLAARARGRGDLAEAEVHLQAAITADPGRERRLRAEQGPGARP